MLAPGFIRYVTGGTTRSPRIIQYSNKRWQRSIAIKARLLASHGVGPGSRVAVCHPFAPWAIGQVFTEASFGCGADVFPLGLEPSRKPFQDLLYEFNPTHICGSARNLVRWANDLKQRGKSFDRTTARTAFIAGEPVSAEIREACATDWNAAVVNIYGLAEFDMIGAEIPGTTGFELVSEYEYCLYHNIDDRFSALQVDALGELSVRERGDISWHKTGDIVRVVRATATPLTDQVWSVEILRRVSDGLFFADGSLLTVEHLDAVLSMCPFVKQLQIQVRRQNTAGDSISVLFVPVDGATGDLTSLVRSSFLECNIDVADSFYRGVILEIEARPTDEASLHVTPRGKMPSIVEIGNGK
jgi:phenylacetate-coenzyme A ligase PaaK-like adenylate-forming protein